MDHIRPRSRKGKRTSANLALACEGCNGNKRDRMKFRDPVSGELVALFHPRRQQWRDHFAWSDDGAQILGLTPTGRATVEALELNRKGLVNLRRVLVSAGEHPPEE